jgi:hypothetical protein
MSQAKASSIDCVAELEDFLKQSGVEDEMKAMLKSMFEVCMLMALLRWP